MSDISESSRRQTSLLEILKQKISAYFSSAPVTNGVAGNGDTATHDASDSEAQFLLNLNKMRELTADEVMIPRADITAFKQDTKVSAVLRKVLKRRHTRYPVYKDTLDEVVGLIHVKDLMAFVCSKSAKMRQETNIVDVPGLMRDIPHVSPSMRALDLLEEMRIGKSHMTLVVDEYGGVDGLITIGDLLGRGRG